MKRLALALLLLSACGGSGSNLHWFATCHSLCISFPDGGGAPSDGGNDCIDHKVGEACSVEGDMCGVSDSCEGPLVCAASDPLAGVACPL